MINDTEKMYIDFASKISFFEFIQEEFRKSDLDLNALREELSLLKSKKICLNNKNLLLSLFVIGGYPCLLFLQEK